MSYNVNDFDGNAATTVYRMVIVRDTTPPVVTLNGPSLVNITKNSVYTDLGATWSDVVDGSGAVIMSGSVNTAILGDYTVSYTHMDVAGNVNTPVTRVIRVGTGGIPVITLIGSGTINILWGNSFVDSGMVANDAEDGNITGSGTRS